MAIPVQGYPDYLIGEDGRIWSKKTHKYLKPAYTKSGNALKSFESAKEASRQTGISQSNILRVAHGNRKTAGGYIWRREEG